MMMMFCAVIVTRPRAHFFLERAREIDEWKERDLVDDDDGQRVFSGSRVPR